MQALIKDNCLCLNGFKCNGTLSPAGLTAPILVNDLIIDNHDKSIFIDTIKSAYKKNVNKLQISIESNADGNVLFVYWSLNHTPIFNNIVLLYKNIPVNNCLLYYAQVRTYNIREDGALTCTTTVTASHIAITENGELYISR